MAPQLYNNFSFTSPPPMPAYSMHAPLATGSSVQMYGASACAGVPFPSRPWAAAQQQPWTPQPPSTTPSFQNMYTMLPCGPTGYPWSTAPSSSRFCAVDETARMVGGVAAPAGDACPTSGTAPPAADAQPGTRLQSGLVYVLRGVVSRAGPPPLCGGVQRCLLPLRNSPHTRRSHTTPELILSTVLNAALCPCRPSYRYLRAGCTAGIVLPDVLQRR